MNLTRQELADQAASLAVQGVYIGTSSWKYSGWCEMLYDRARHECRGNFAESRFEKNCLAEYAEGFKTFTQSFPAGQVMFKIVEARAKTARAEIG